MSCHDRYYRLNSRAVAALLGASLSEAAEAGGRIFTVGCANVLADRAQHQFAFFLNSLPPNKARARNSFARSNQKERG
jgi:hypothetical protein